MKKNKSGVLVAIAVAGLLTTSTAGTKQNQSRAKRGNPIQESEQLWFQAKENQWCVQILSMTAKGNNLLKENKGKTYDVKLMKGCTVKYQIIGKKGEPVEIWLYVRYKGAKDAKPGTYEHARHWFYHKVLKEKPSVPNEADQKCIPAILVERKKHTPKNDSEELSKEWDGRDGSKCDCNRILLAGEYELVLRVYDASDKKKSREDIKHFTIAQPHAFSYGAYEELRRDKEWCIKRAKKVKESLKKLGFQARIMPADETTAEAAYKGLTDMAAAYWSYQHGSDFKTLVFKRYDVKEGKILSSFMRTEKFTKQPWVEKADVELPKKGRVFDDMLFVFPWACITDWPNDNTTIMARFRALGADITIAFTKLWVRSRNGKGEPAFVSSLVQFARTWNKADNVYPSTAACVKQAIKAAKEAAKMVTPPYEEPVPDEKFNDSLDSIRVVYNKQLFHGAAGKEPEPPHTALYPARYGCWWGRKK